MTKVGCYPINLHIIVTWFDSILMRLHMTVTFFLFNITCTIAKMIFEKKKCKIELLMNFFT